MLGEDSKQKPRREPGRLLDRLAAVWAKADLARLARPLARGSLELVQVGLGYQVAGGELLAEFARPDIFFNSAQGQAEVVSGFLVGVGCNIHCLGSL